MANEKRLIDATALDNKLDALAKKYTSMARFEAAKDYSFVQTVLLTAPTVDAVEVVRCKDCKKWFRVIGRDERTLLGCRHMGITTNPDDFCSYGERKDNA